jgi:hypothetical protein
MIRTLRVTLLLSLASAPIIAASWSGALVDSECYAAAQRNVNPGEHPGSVDTKRPIRYCSPNEKTKSFAVVDPNGVFSLDSDGNEKARQLIMKEGKKSPFTVIVTGEMIQHIVKVDTISIAR